VGYDVELIQIAVEPEQSFPISADEVRSRELRCEPFASIEQVRATLLQLQGTRSGPDGTVDYLGQGLNHARFRIQPDAIHVDNNLNAAELLKIYTHLVQTYPRLLIHDLQSGQIHNAASYADWWTRPL